eukprot:g187.t1
MAGACTGILMGAAVEFSQPERPQSGVTSFGGRLLSRDPIKNANAQHEIPVLELPPQSVSTPVPQPHDGGWHSVLKNYHDEGLALSGVSDVPYAFTPLSMRLNFHNWLTANLQQDQNRSGFLQRRSATAGALEDGAIGKELVDLGDQVMDEAMGVVESGRTMVLLAEAVSKGNPVKIAEQLAKLKGEASDIVAQYGTILKTCDAIRALSMQFEKEKGHDFQALAMGVLFVYSDSMKTFVEDMDDIRRKWKGGDAAARGKALDNLKADIVKSLGETAPIWTNVSTVLDDFVQVLGNPLTPTQKIVMKQVGLLDGFSRMAVNFSRMYGATPEGLKLKEGYAKFFGALVDFFANVADTTPIVRELFRDPTYSSELLVLWSVMPAADKHLEDLLQQPVAFLGKMIADQKYLSDAQKTPQMKKMLGKLQVLKDRCAAEGKEIVGMEQALPEITQVYEKYLNPTGQEVGNQFTRLVGALMKEGMEGLVFATDGQAYAIAQDGSQADKARKQLMLDVQALDNSSRIMVQDLSELLGVEAKYQTELGRMFSW